MSKLLAILFLVSAASASIEDAASDKTKSMLDEDGEVEETEVEGMKVDPVTGKRMYDGYQVIRVVPSTEMDLSTLRFLEKGERITKFA